ncbi:hypothetical protein T440DRAFT_402897 [Plenodomus tracheiphilus IPT5]|uniref:WDR59/RTC1-like RING zinc finger domain-containing protein n=1 Tax=Plenodomus tracheiphilus IPT5 TaxID=1408161 RepID=A0A6A7AXI4_9PLEO|nr:hypothetical protein T440DRAFT_402897 [Plenodomus tracheiphilus IPT5]
MAANQGPSSAYESSTFDRSLSIAVNDEIGSASISPAGRDVVLASKNGLRIIDLDNPYSLPLYIPSQSSWDVADVQWSPFAARAEWIASTRNQLALIYNLAMPYNNKKAPIEYTLRAHERAITDINFSAHHPDLLATCGVDSFVFVHDLRSSRAPLKLADFTAGATQVKWNRQDDKIIASAHDKYLHIWDIRKGATPLSTIAAHSTKIYGIDWNRNDANKIMTCSLDMTIKLWNNVGITANIDTPRRVINTHYPVWRARHTPFPAGILAMPQRGNSSLWLYKHVNDSDPSTFVNQPAYAFEGHEPDAQVREFLWRTRGPTDSGLDNRDFQLVSWGTDKHLHLHRISADLLQNSVGFRKGDPLLEKPSATRRGAEYISYRDGPVTTSTATARNGFGPPHTQRKGNLSTLLQNYTLNEDIYTSRVKGKTQPRLDVETLPRETMTAQPIRRNNPRVVTHITWMDGVKFGDRHKDVNDFRARPNQYDREEKYPYQEQNDLGAEISYVGNKYKKITFEQIDVPGRRITISFSGPWGDYDANTEDLKLVFLRFTIKFPVGYPKMTEKELPGVMPTRIRTPLEIEFERTTASISKENQDDLMDNMTQIANTCALQEREALEAVLSYALGERGLDDSLKLVEDNHILEDLGPLPGESSSEDDEHDGEFTNDAMQSSHTNANVPLPIQCTVRFSVNGSLVLARIPSTKSAPGLDTIQFQIARNLRHGINKNDIFDSFGRLTAQLADDSDNVSSTSSADSWEGSSSPSSSSGINHDANTHIGNFQPPLAWQKAASRFQSRNSLPSSTGAGKQAPKTRSIVSILRSTVDDLIPSKKVLAEEYRIFGPGPLICEHNSKVARKHGLGDLADIWMLCKLILNNEVPLEILPQQHRKDQVLVLARRALVRIKRKDSGLDLQFDEADTVTNPKLKGRIKWGDHTVATWVIPALFDHFERLADTQMLAMLSCIFAEPAAREGVTSAMAKMRQSQLPMSMEAPAFSLDYFSSADAAWSLFRPTISVPSTPAHSRLAAPANDFGWHRLSRNVDTYGSHGSSNGPWGSDTVNSEPITPYSTGNTPPALSRASTMRSAQTAGHTPYSTSPEQSHGGLKRSSTANFASAVAALSRPFANAMSSSPPVKARMEDLSTSAPTSGVTWGTTTFYGSETQDRNGLAPIRSKHGKRASFGQAEQINVDYIYDSDSDYERVNDDGNNNYDRVSEYTTPGTPRGDAPLNSIRVTLKNQDQFDDEACVSKPLLDMSKDWLYRAWREQYADMLSCWGLISQRAEVLKFNGLVSYFPPIIEQSRIGSRAGSMYLALDEEANGIVQRHLSRASTTLSAPPMAMAQMGRSPAVSLRQFSFNPEAQEFQPGTPPFLPAETLALLPDVAIPTEQYLHLSIPAPTPTKELAESLAGLGTSPGQDKLHPQQGRTNRPSLSRGTSNISGTSSWRDGRSRVNTSTNTPAKPNPKEPVYSCGICWIRVQGRVYVCPACGHVAHFDCMDDEIGGDEGECMVGCGCGCGLEDNDERSRMEAYLDDVRAANAAGQHVAWGEDGESTFMHSQPPTPSLYENSVYGDSMTGLGGKMIDQGEEKRRERLAGRSTANTSPTPSRDRKKKKTKKKTRASGLSYY